MTPKPSDLVRERPPCPTPTKQVFRSKAAARRYHRSMRLPAGEKDHLHPYWCVGGHWHLTRQDPETQVQTALRIQRMARFRRQQAACMARDDDHPPRPRTTHHHRQQEA